MLPCFDSPTSVKSRPAPSASPLAAAVHAGRHHVRLVRWTLGVMGAMAPGLTFGLLAVSFAGGLTTLALFIAIRCLIDAQARSLGGQPPPFETLIPWLALLFAAAATEALVSLARKLLRNLLLDRADLDLTAAVMRKAASQPVAFFEQPSSQDILERLQGQVATRLVELVLRVMSVVTMGLQVLTMMAVLVHIEPLIVVVAVPLFIPYLWFQTGLSRDASSEHAVRAVNRRRIRYYLGHLTRASGAAELRLLGIAPHFIERFRAVMSDFVGRDARRHWRDFWGGTVFALLSLGGFLGVFAMVVQRALGGQASIGEVAVFAAAAVRLRKSLEDMGQAVNIGLDQARHVEALRVFLECPPEEDADAGDPLPTPFRADIRCEHVSFRYPGADTLALDDLCLDIAAGETVAIVGENGSGKTTLVKLLAGFHAPTDGRILVSGRDIRELSLTALRSRISFVFQEFGRYAVSLRENIAYGDWLRLRDAPEAVADCARRAGLADAAARMPEGLDTVLGREFGAFEPSGGVWQRIAIARALARDAPLLILDEPTAAVDARAEYGLFRQLAKLAEGRTTLLISHRFSTVSMAQRILVMHHGRIVEQGGHDELLALGGRYAELYNYHQRRMSGA